MNYIFTQFLFYVSNFLYLMSIDILKHEELKRNFFNDTFS